MARKRAYPAPCLLQLRRQVDRAYPGRSTASDGIMGDARHRLRRSDHNLGNAIDLTHSLEDGFDVGRLADALRRQMKTAPAGRVSYLIFRARITSAISEWDWRPYAGSNPHTNHLHLSIVASRRDVIRSWKLD